MLRGARAIRTQW